jgi:hypothetical protein
MAKKSIWMATLFELPAPSVGPTEIVTRKIAIPGLNYQKRLWQQRSVIAAHRAVMLIGIGTFYDKVSENFVKHSNRNRSKP